MDGICIVKVVNFSCCMMLNLKAFEAKLTLFGPEGNLKTRSE